MKIYMSLQERRETVYNGEPWVKLTFAPFRQILEDGRTELAEDNPSRIVLHLPQPVAEKRFGQLAVGLAVRVDVALGW
jgi:hypothetical protein